MSSFNSNANDNSDTGGASAQGGFNQTPNPDQGASGGAGEVDLAKLQKRLDDSQAFIEQLKRERQEDRRLIEELRSKPSHSLDEIKDLITKARADGTDPTIDPDTLVKTVYERVNQTMSQQEAQKREKANFDEVTKTLTSRFGADVDAKVSEIAQEVGLSLAEVVEMSKKNPKAVYKLLGITEQSTIANSSRGSVNTFGMAPPPPAKTPSIMSARNERERVDVFAQRLAQYIQKNHH